MKRRGERGEESDRGTGNVRKKLSESLHRFSRAGSNFRVGIESEDQALLDCRTEALIDKSEWLTTIEAAVHLRKFLPDGVTPSINAVYKMESKGAIRGRKFNGRLYFRRRELDFQIDTSVR
jgi:hypothetical protein